MLLPGFCLGLMLFQVGRINYYYYYYYYYHYNYDDDDDDDDSSNIRMSPMSLIQLGRHM